jgi:pimeloyl-ACP methyl ester carboxylesterase
MKASLSLLLVAIAVGSAGPAAARVDAPTPRPPCLRASDGARVLQFRAADRTRLLAITMGRGATGVVLAHHWRGSLCSWMAYARVLKAKGFRVLAFDFRGHGFSGYPPYPRAEYLQRDVVAAVRVLRGLGATRIVLAGESMGGTAVLHAAATLNPQPVAVVSLSAPTVFGRLNGTQALSRLRIPVLLVAAENDDGFADEARQLLASADPATTRLEIVPGGAHGADMLRATRVRDLVTAFIETHGLNESIDVRLEAHPTGGHGFDAASPARRTLAIMRTTLTFFRASPVR